MIARGMFWHSRHLIGARDKVETKERKGYLSFRAFLFLEDKFREEQRFMDILMLGIYVVILIYKISFLWNKLLLFVSADTALFI